MSGSGRTGRTRLGSGGGPGNRDNAPGSRTGRRPGTSQTRATILAEARRQFATRGYDATSMRSIASTARVDPALLVHYFGTKEGLFVASMDFPAQPSTLFGPLLDLPLPEAVEGLTRTFLELVDSDGSRNAILALVRSAVSSEQAAATLREFVAAELLSLLRRMSDRPDAPLRASLVAAQLVGIAMLRHVVRLPPVARASRAQLVALVAPVVMRYLA